MRARIQVVADGLGYRTNTLARELRSGSSRSVGLALVDVANPFYADVAKGVIDVAEAQGYATLVSQVGPTSEHLDRISDTFVDRRLAGVLFTSLRNSDAPTLVRLQSNQIPFVKLVRDVDGIDADWVGIDDFQGGVDLGNHLADIGCRRVALLGGPADSNASNLRRLGIKSSLSGRGVAIVNAHDDTITGIPVRSSGQERTHAVLDAEHAVDGIVGGNDVIALGILDACAERGIDVPGDLVVAGFDNMSLSHVGPLQLTTVNVPREEIGRQGASFLLDRIAGFSGKGRREVLPHGLVIRKTTQR
jgi:LacI family transcriptional regulator